MAFQNQQLLIAPTPIKQQPIDTIIQQNKQQSQFHEKNIEQENQDIQQQNQLINIIKAQKSKQSKPVNNAAKLTQIKNMRGGHNSIKLNLKNGNQNSIQNEEKMQKTLQMQIAKSNLSNVLQQQQLNSQYSSNSNFNQNNQPQNLIQTQNINNNNNNNNKNCNLPTSNSTFQKGNISKNYLKQILQQKQTKNNNNTTTNNINNTNSNYNSPHDINLIKQIENLRSKAKNPHINNPSFDQVSPDMEESFKRRKQVRNNDKDSACNNIAWNLMLVQKISGKKEPQNQIQEANSEDEQESIISGKKQKIPGQYLEQQNKANEQYSAEKIISNFIVGKNHSDLKKQEESTSISSSYMMENLETEDSLSNDQAGILNLNEFNEMIQKQSDPNFDQTDFVQQSLILDLQQQIVHQKAQILMNGQGQFGNSTNKMSKDPNALKSSLMVKKKEKDHSIQMNTLNNRILIQNA